MQEVLYRFFDSEGTLLYVGISNDWISRLRHHEQHSDFFSAVSDITFERYPDRPAVVAAELMAITTEDPLFNRAGNPNYQTWQTHFREVMAMCVDKRKADNKHRHLVDEMRGEDPQDLDYFPSARWFAGLFPSTWYYLAMGYDFECELCEEVARHPTVHAWKDMERGDV